MNERISVCMNEWMYVCMYDCLNKKIKEWMNEWMDGWKNRRINDEWIIKAMSVWRN